MKKNSCLAAALLAAMASFSMTAHAVQPTDFDAMPVSAQCTRTFTNYTFFLEGRDKGLTREEALKISATHGPGQALPAESINNAYDFRTVHEDGLAAYFLWSCHAQEIGLPILSLSAVADDMRECYKNPDRRGCSPTIRNKILGLPADYVPTIPAMKTVRPVPK